ncbi:hypothetical protein DFH08DRAFT_805223 [Mycena albidolilacea]|uniref:Uncharacterized protein n=1 Tax=Mycena albidolilacea TaxID=1033008 RepID=A0AAD7ABQ9_9AGAR|nr:hypothetical protein DFH08DRAFT_805223 [Mycena albidolilacea]
MDHLLCLASEHRKLSTPPFIGQTELLVLTSTAGYIAPATQNPIVWNWIMVINKLYIAMKDLRSLYKGCPVYILGCERPSLMPWILELLTPSLLVKLPADFLRAYGLSVPQLAVSVQDTAHQTASACERERAHLPLQGSRALLTRIETGGLVSSQMSMVIHAAGAAKSVNPSRIDAAAVDTPLTPSLPCMTTVAPVTLLHGREASSVELRGISTKPTNGLDHLTFEYMASADLACQQATDIANQSVLCTEDIVDHDECMSPSSPHLGRFGLEANLFIRVGKVMTAMQSLLTHVFGVAEIHCAWDGLVERLGIAQTIFDLYQQGCTNPERKACDAAAHRWVMQWARKDVALPIHQTPGARKHRGPSDVAQSATGGVIIPVTSPLLAVMCAPTPAGLLHLSSHPMEDGIGMGECTAASGHAHTQAVPVVAEKLEQAEFRASSHDSKLTSPDASKKQLNNCFAQQAPAQGTRRTPVTQGYGRWNPVQHFEVIASPSLVVDSFAPPVVVKNGGLKGVHEEFTNSDGAGTLTIHPLVCSCRKGLPRARASPIEPPPVLFQACLHKCPAPSMVELGGLNSTTPHSTVDSGRGSSESDEQGVVSKGEEVRTLVCGDRRRTSTAPRSGTVLRVVYGSGKQLRGFFRTYLESTRYNDGTATRPRRRLDAERPETHIPQATNFLNQFLLILYHFFLSDSPLSPQFLGLYF